MKKIIPLYQALTTNGAYRIQSCSGRVGALEVMTEGLGPSCTLLETLHTLPHTPPPVPPDKVRNTTSKLSMLLCEQGGALG